MSWSRATNVLWRSAPGYLVLVTPDGDPSEVLGPGAEVWALLQVPVETDALVDEMASKHSTDRDVVASDIARLLDQLHAGGYVDRTD